MEGENKEGDIISGGGEEEGLENCENGDSTPLNEEDEAQLKAQLSAIAASSSLERVARGGVEPKPTTNSSSSHDAMTTINSTPPATAANNNATIEPSSYPLLFKSLPGYCDRRNDVLYYPATETASDNVVDGIDYGEGGGDKVLVFFGGDIQDLSSCMPPSSPYLNYSLDSTTSTLHSHLPSHHILVIRPSSFKPPYSCYDNFVPPSPAHNSGIPEHTANHNAMTHLELLLRETSRLYNGGGSDEVTSTTNDLDLSKCKLALVGFSKGSVVLNQMLYEFHFYNTLHPESPPPFLSRISHMYWLDGGHGGGKNTWITARPILDTLSRLNIRIHVHMTPYQLNDDRRPYIRNEEKLFGTTLTRMGVQLERRLWFEGEQSLEAHFALINAVFKKK